MWSEDSKDEATLAAFLGSILQGCRRRAELPLTSQAQIPPPCAAGARGTVHTGGPETGPKEVRAAETPSAPGKQTDRGRCSCCRSPPSFPHTGR